MTEAEWLASDNVERMLATVSSSNQRKLRLFACACCRQTWQSLTEQAQGAIEATEHDADGTVDRAEVLMKRQSTRGLSLEAHAAVSSATEVSEERESFDPQYAWKWAAAASDDAPAAWAAQSQILRCLFHPFRSITSSPEWRTDTAIALARGIYDSREFGAMPILADALQDAGCDNDDILAHCRSGEAHVRGCWVVDLVLGKE